jgi:hypothetical protein
MVAVVVKPRPSISYTRLDVCIARCLHDEKNARPISEAPCGQQRYSYDSAPRSWRNRIVSPVLMITMQGRSGVYETNQYNMESPSIADILA